MAVTIGAFAHQRVTIATEVALDINIDGNPDYAYIEGLLEGFWTNWKDPTLEVRGTATRLVSNVPITVKAVKGSDNPVTRSGFFSVVPAAPVITEPGRQALVRGVENEFIVNISNSPSKVQAVGPWLGMKYEPHPDGIRIFGDVPEVLHSVPSAEQKIRVTAETGALRDEVEIGFDLLNRFVYGALNRDVIYRIQLNDSDLSVSSDLNFDTNFSQIRHLAADADYVYFSALANRRGVYRVPRDTGNSQSVNATRIGYFRNIGLGIAIDGNSVYRVEEVSGNEQIRVFDKSTGSTIRTFRLDVNFYARGIAIDGDDLIVLLTRPGANRQELRWYNKNARGTANHTREITLPGQRYRYYYDLTVFGGMIYVTYHGTTNPRLRSPGLILMINIETGVVEKTYSIPASLSPMYAFTMVIG